MRNRTAAVTTLGFALLLASSATGCGFMKSLIGKNSVDLSEADVKTIAADIRKPQKTICPREIVQMVVTAEVMLKGDDKAKTLQTYEGGAGANKNDKMEFTDFGFASPQGAFDEFGFFAPNKNVIATAGTEFEIQTVYKRRADKLNVKAKYKPDYACIKEAGALGEPGQPGETGPGGRSGEMAMGGRNGGNGAPGGPGAGGGDGAPGPRIQAFVTFVKTPFYDKLFAVRITGDKDDLLLAPADRPFTIHANGGAGGVAGSGGAGGAGGSGGAGQTGQDGGDGGDGATGGQGGSGGRGGPGGTVELVYDAKYPELARLIVADVSGGVAGEAGHGGEAGAAGGSGSGGGQGTQSGKTGRAGARGANGAAGTRGADGRAAVRAGGVKDKFADVAPIAMLDETPDAPLDPKALAAEKKLADKMGAKKKDVLPKAGAKNKFAK